MLNGFWFPILLCVLRHESLTSGVGAPGVALLPVVGGADGMRTGDAVGEPYQVFRVDGALVGCFYKFKFLPRLVDAHTLGIGYMVDKMVISTDKLFGYLLIN